MALWRGSEKRKKERKKNNFFFKVIKDCIAFGLKDSKVLKR